MNVFTRPPLHVSATENRRARWLFFALFLVGVGLRGVTSFETLAIAHPDEHQQFLEQAQRMVFGYGHQFWEQERGMRHPLYPALLALPLAALEAVGVHDSFVQAALLRWLVSILVLFACALFAWEFHRRGDTPMALLLMFALALSPDVIYTHIHPLSEIGATIPFLLALVLMERNPFAAGALLALAFGIRFQMGFIIAATVILVWVRHRCHFDRPFLQLSFGFGLIMFGLGLIDRLFYGVWFHSPLAYVNANVVEGLASEFGVEPWYQYVFWLREGGWAVVLPLAALVLLGVRREWTFALLAVAFVVPHMMVAHKEAHFMLPIAPLLLVLIAAGFSEVCRMFEARYREVIFILALIGLTAIAVVRIPEIKWQMVPYRPMLLLLHAAGKQADLTGIVVFGQVSAECPNYFYLRRNVPLVALYQPDAEALRQEIESSAGRINYVTCRKDYAVLFREFQPREIASYEGYSLYRLENPGGDVR